jgi:hypothetical protein
LPFRFVAKSEDGREVIDQKHVGNGLEHMKRAQQEVQIFFVVDTPRKEGSKEKIEGREER